MAEGDLYDALGVPKDAATEDIRRAYRDKAKTAHPDAGGSDEEMTRLNRAVAILSDPEQRDRYDKTGEENLSNREHMAKTCVIDCMLAVIAVVEQQPGPRGGKTDPCTVDLVAIADKAMVDKLSEIARATRDALADARRLEKIANRFRGAEIIKKALLDRAKAAEQAAVANEENGEIVKMARGILSDASFEFDQFGLWDRNDSVDAFAMMMAAQSGWNGNTTT